MRSFSVLTALTGLAAAPLLTALPASAATPWPVQVELRLPAASTYGQQVTATATVSAQTTPGTSPVSQDAVTFQREDGNGDWVDLATATTGEDGAATAGLQLPAGTQHVRAEAAGTAPSSDPSDPLAAGTQPGDSQPATITVAPARVSIAAASRLVRSESVTSLTVSLHSPTLPGSAFAGRVLTVQETASYAPSRNRTTHVTLGARGAASLRVATWHGTTYRITAPATASTDAATTSARLRTRGILSAISQRSQAHPAVRYPIGQAPVGGGVNVRTSTISDAQWARMVGNTWQPGCPTGRGQLRYLTLNYWGFDGYRHRGAIVVAGSVAAATARAFTSLYAQHFRIRQMVPEDVYGRNPKGPGANDYAAMAADDTSGFNCRYVDGKEAQRVWSPHAYGVAVDVNTFENPYVAPTGVFPDRYWLRHRRGVGVLRPGSAAVRAFTSNGFTWGGIWSPPDFQHFQR